MPALTRTEAQRRAELLDVRSYSLDLDLTLGEKVFGSTTTVRFACAQPGAGTFIDVEPATLHRVVLNGVELDPASLKDSRLALDRLAADNELVIEADMRYSRTGEGMHRFVDPVDQEVYVYTQCAVADARRVFAAFDQPDLKAVFEVAITAPQGWTVLANSTGSGQPSTTGSSSTPASRWTFAPTPPISTYLAVVVAGPYHSISAQHDEIPLGLHCRRSLAQHLDEQADELFDVTRRCLDHYHRIFTDRYPFGVYDQAFVPELNFGAMENPGCVTLQDEYVFRAAVTETQREERAMVIAHEMAHMWFGDLVTMRWWDDLWLNESFAEYMGFQTISEVTAFTGTWTGFGIRRKPGGYDADQRPTTHPVAPDAVDDTAEAMDNLDGISYAKGGSALRQLVTWLGEEAFLAGVNTHFARHRFGNATLADLISALADASGRDVAGWADRWLRTTGVDTLRPEHPDTAAEATINRRPHRVAVGLYDRDGAELVLRERLTVDLEADQPGVIPVAEPRPDLIVTNDHDLTFAKIRFDPTSWQTVVESLGQVTDPLSRTVLWTAARDMVRDGELPGLRYFELVARHLPAEPVVAIVAGVLDVARQFADQFVPPRRRGEALSVLDTVCRQILRRTEDGTQAGLRLSAVRGLIGCAQGPKAIAELVDWLEADRVPGGPVLDAELRWKALLRLSVLGAAGNHEIEAELRRDPTASGRQGAASCRAASPDRAAKEASWRSMFHDQTQSNYLLRATASGFWQPEQSALLEEWVPRYFPDVVEAAARRGPAVAQALTQLGFPRHAADPTTLQAGEDCLRQPELIPALRRGLTDRLDDLRRAVRARRAQHRTAAR